MANKRSKTIPPQMKVFADAFFMTRNKVEAAREAGYSGTDKALAVRASELLKDDRVAAYLKERSDRLLEREDNVIDDLLNDLKLLSKANMKNYASWKDGKVEYKDSEEITDEEAYAIRKVKSKTHVSYGKEGDISSETSELEIELHNKESALKLRASYYGIDSDWNAIVAGLARFNLVLKEDNTQSSGWRVDRLEKK